MAKQDVLDAINATIVPNNLKGINADSLRNILTMIVENAGEGGSGSGDGALRVIVPDTLMSRDAFIEAGGFTPENWEVLRDESAAAGMDMTEFDIVVTSAFEHNSQVYQTLVEKAKAGEGVLCKIDQSAMSIAVNRMQEQMYGQQMYEEVGLSMSQIAQVAVVYIDPVPELEELMPLTVEVAITPASFRPDNIETGERFYQSDTTLLLQPDGSILFVPTTEEPEQEPES